MYLLQLVALMQIEILFFFTFTEKGNNNHFNHRIDRSHNSK